MGVVVHTIYICDRCGAQAEPPLPDHCSKMHMEYISGPPAELDRIFCPSCTEAIVAFVTTPP